MTITFTAAAYPPPPPLLRIAARAPRPLGFWLGLGWTGLAVLAFFAVPILYGITAAMWNLGRTAHRMPLPQGNSLVNVIIFMSALAALFAIIVLACRCSGWRALDYLALTRPRGSFLRLGALAFAVPLAVSLAAAVYGGPGSAGGPPSTTSNLVLLLIAVTVLAPVCEEVVFRGFLFRVLADSRLGVTVAIVVTALLWAALHTDKSWMGMAAVFFSGLVWGWLRWHTQSTLATIAVHGLNNLVAAVGITAVALSAGT
jgi:membrane protease YdiL (CAAX protease family)